MEQRGQSTLEYLALLALLCAVLAAAVASARLRHLGPGVIAAVRSAIVGDDGAGARTRALAAARGALAGETPGGATTTDALMLLRAAYDADGARRELDDLAVSIVRIRRPDLFAARSYALVPALSPAELRSERRGFLLTRAEARGEDRSVETTSTDVAPQVRLLSQSDEARGLLAVAEERDANARQKAWLAALAPLAIAGVAAVAPETLPGVAVGGSEAVTELGEGALDGTTIAELVGKIRAGQRAVYPPASRRGDLLVCLPVLRTNLSGEPVPVPGVSHTNLPASGAPIATTFSLWHTVVMRVGIVIDEEVTRDSPCEAARTW